MNDTLTTIYDRIARESLDGCRPCVIGVNGMDCSGKTHFARGLAAYLQRGGHAVGLLHIDDFNDRDVQREVYDAFTEGRFTAAHLDQFYAGSINYERAACAIEDAAQRSGTLVVEGVFLYKAALRDYFTYRVFLEISQSVGRARYATRKEAEKDPRPLEVFEELWVPAHERYVRECRPRECAEIILSNDHWDSPVVLST